MSYHDLSGSALNEAERAAEANRILRIIEDDVLRMNDKERDFVEKMKDARYCSVKQLFYLRDLKDKYL